MLDALETHRALSLNTSLPIIVIAGATATGKTAAAIAVAKRLGGEIISADSMQVYKYMDIGTAKPETAEMQGIPHYLIDELLPDEEYNAVVFKERAERYIAEIRSRGKIPIVAGGTGFYINALTKSAEFSKGAVNLEIRELYKEMAERRGNGHVHGILTAKDPLTAAKIHENDIKRVIRALEYFEMTGGASLAEHNLGERAKEVRSDALIFVLDMNRQELYERIDRRVDVMLEKGLQSEVSRLLEMGYDENLNSMKAIGYREMLAFLRGECVLEDTVAKIKQSSRNYAKRQFTWFRRQTDGVFLDVSLGIDKICEIICEAAEKYIENCGEKWI